LKELETLFNEYTESHSNCFSPEHIPFLTWSSVIPMDREAAIAFLKYARQQYLEQSKGVKDDRYWLLLAFIGDAYLNLEMKHHASKMFRKIKEKSSFSPLLESTVIIPPLSFFPT